MILVVTFLIIGFFNPTVVARNNESERLTIKTKETLKNASKKKKNKKKYKNIISKVNSKKFSKNFNKSKIICDRKIISKIVTVYDEFTKDEIMLMWRVIQTEAGRDGDLESKSHIASVILNQWKNPRFKEKTITKMIKYPNRFAYSESPRKINETTKKALEIAFAGDTAQGAIAFHAGRKTKTFCRSFNYIFTDKVGHHFYK